MTQFLIILLIGFIIYLAIGEDVMRMLRRRTEGYRVKYTKYLTRAVVVPSLVFVVLGLLMRDVILTLYLFAIAAGLAYLRIRRDELLLRGADIRTPLQQ